MGNQESGWKLGARIEIMDSRVGMLLLSGLILGSCDIFMYSQNILRTTMDGILH